MIKRLLVALLLATAAEAQQLRVVTLPGEGALDRAELADVIARAEAHFLARGIAVKAIKVLPLRADPCESQRERDRFPSQFACYEKIGLDLKRFRYGPTLIVSAPMRGGGERWLGGVARRDCLRHISRRVAWAAATARKVTGEDRKIMAGVLAAHEVAHTLGAGHYDSRPNIMHSAALQFAGNTPDLGFVGKTVDEVRACSFIGTFRR